MRSRSRSRSRSPKYPRYSRNTRARSRSRSRSPFRPRRQSREDDFADCVDHGYRARVKEAVDAKVKEYVGSEEFRVMVESLKRRERERILAEVQSEMEVEKKLMITTAREQLQKELNALGILKPSDVLSTTAVTSSSDGGSDAELADVILLRNKQKMEEQQRQEFLRKQAEDARRLEEVLRNKRIEEELERQRLEALHHEAQLLEAELLQHDEDQAQRRAVGDGGSDRGGSSGSPRGSETRCSAGAKLSFGLKKRNALC